MNTEFKDALDAVNESLEYYKNAPHPSIVISDNHKQTIRRALKIAHRLVQEPSEGMRQLSSSDWPSTDWENMRDQMLAEIDNADGDGV